MGEMVELLRYMLMKKIRTFCFRSIGMSVGDLVERLDTMGIQREAAVVDMGAKVIPGKPAKKLKSPDRIVCSFVLGKN